MPTTTNPTKLEMTVLSALWKTGPASVRQVFNLLNEEKTVGYTTVLKIFQIMLEKGLVERDDSVRPQIYRPRYSIEQTQKGLVQDLIERVYGGSVKALVMQALSTRKATQKDLDAVEKLLDRFEGGAK